MIHYPTRKDLIASFAKDTVGVEVGVQAGVFSQEILDCGVKHLHLVDPWEHQTGVYELDPANIDQVGHDTLYRSVVEKFGDNPRVTIHRAYSRDCRHYEPNRPTWMYLDGDHTYLGVAADLRVGYLDGYTRILGHDYIENEQSIKMGFAVKRAVDEFCRIFGWQMTAITDEEWPSYMLERK